MQVKKSQLFLKAPRRRVMHFKALNEIQNLCPVWTKTTLQFNCCSPKLDDSTEYTSQASDVQ